MARWLHWPKNGPPDMESTLNKWYCYQDVQTRSPQSIDIYTESLYDIKRTSIALRKFRTLKGLRKGPLAAKNLRLMVTKFEETGSLNVRSGRGKKTCFCGSNRESSPSGVRGQIIQRAG
ncbi:hypothetical protein TNCV_4077461 [Trichonephila clavipes]|uniref:DUF4817 domain-containing protein n=1 Tax=Trichonephila clavipes TaxID=2585209 RepID=A0A8X6R807_TRICX|nr:hypothetical protein TNCV_4077461 [Trichonephila clavipes]